MCNLGENGTGGTRLHLQAHPRHIWWKAKVMSFVSLLLVCVFCFQEVGGLKHESRAVGFSHRSVEICCNSSYTK